MRELALFLLSSPVWFLGLLTGYLVKCLVWYWSALVIGFKDGLGWDS